MAGGGAAIIGAFAATLALDAKDYERGADDAEKSNKRIGESVGKFLVGGMLAGTAAMAGAAYGATRLADRVLNTAEIVNQLAGETGIGTDFIQAFSASMVQATGSTEGAYAALRAYTRAIGEVRAGTRGGKLVEDALEKIGIDPRTLREGEAGLLQIVDALIAVESRQARAAAASKIFGDQGAAIAVMFEGGVRSAEEFVAKQVRLGQVISSDALPALGAMSDQVDVLKAALQGLPVQLMAEFLAGFQGSSSGTKGIEEIAASLQDQLLPAARDLGAELKQMVPTLQEIRGIVDEIEKIRNRSVGENIGRGVFGLGKGLFWDYPMFMRKQIWGAMSHIPDAAEWAGYNIHQAMYWSPTGPTNAP